MICSYEGKLGHNKLWNYKKNKGLKKLMNQKGHDAGEPTVDSMCNENRNTKVK